MYTFVLNKYFLIGASFSITYMIGVINNYKKNPHLVNRDIQRGIQSTFLLQHFLAKFTPIYSIFLKQSLFHFSTFRDVLVILS